MNRVYQIDDLRNWREVTRDMDPPVRLGLMGDPVGHSLSPRMQNAALLESQIEAQYAAFHIEAENLREALKIVRDVDFIGLNLTAPHKIAAAKWVDELDPIAKEVGAINAIGVNNGKLRGYNTDGEGFARAIREEFAVSLCDLSLLVLGAGGAARAIAFFYARGNGRHLVIANRTFDKARVLADEIGVIARAITLDEIDSVLPQPDLVVNATALGLQGNDPSPIPARLLSRRLLIYDTIYAEFETKLIAEARMAGTRAANGLSMLLHQGILAFECWFDRKAPSEPMRVALRAAGRSY